MRNWTPTEGAILQGFHVSLAVNIVTISSLAGYSAATGFWCVVAWASGKEFIWDIWMENTTWGEEFIDFAFYVAGGGVASALCAWLRGP